MNDWAALANYKKKRTRAGWAWEFMRRNPKYRADFQKLSQKWAAIPKKGFLYVGGGPVHAEQFGRVLGAKWGQAGAIADPKQDSAPKFMQFGPIIPDGESVDVFFEDVEGNAIPQREEFATLVFDVRRPIGPQLRRAKTYLKVRAADIKEQKIKPIRSSETWWPAYLLVLDAKAANASNAEIAAQIPVIKVLKDKYEASKRVSEYYKRAKQLRDNPLGILL